MRARDARRLDRSALCNGTADQLARAARCSTVDVVQALTDIQTTGAADVEERNGMYSVRNRRMLREADIRKANSDRQKRHRTAARDGPVTELSHKNNNDPTLFWESFMERVSFPERMNTKEVRSALLEWLVYKAKRGEKYKDPSFVGRKVAEFSASGPDAFVSAVNSSIGNNYSGLFPAKEVRNGKLSERTNRAYRYQPDPGE